MSRQYVETLKRRVEVLEQKYFNDEKRLRELKQLKQRVEEDPPPLEVFKSALSLIERGIMPSTEQILLAIKKAKGEK